MTGRNRDRNPPRVCIRSPPTISPSDAGHSFSLGLPPLFISSRVSEGEVVVLLYPRLPDLAVGFGRRKILQVFVTFVTEKMLQLISKIHSFSLLPFAQRREPRFRFITVFSSFFARIYKKLRGRKTNEEAEKERYFARVFTWSRSIVFQGRASYIFSYSPRVHYSHQLTGKKSRS